MEINVIPLGDMGTNCYLINGITGAVVIDPGYKSEKVLDFLKNNSNKERLILLTHNHFDHISGALALSSETNSKIAIGQLDNNGLSDANINLSVMFCENIAPFSADILLNDNEKITVGDLEFTVLHTPGHTVGSVSFLSGDCLFAGDTLFYESIGRTDFPGGNFGTIKKSIIRLYALGDNLTVYSGHGPATTIGHEKLFNPYVRAD